MNNADGMRRVIQNILGIDGMIMIMMMMMMIIIIIEITTITQPKYVFMWHIGNEGLKKHEHLKEVEQSVMSYSIIVTFHCGNRTFMSSGM